MKPIWMIPLALGLFTAEPAMSAAAPDSGAAYLQHCAGCHGSERHGFTGPALLPESLSRLRPEAALEVIRRGRRATQMPAYEGILDAATIEGLARLIYQPPAREIVWGAAEIAASQWTHDGPVVDRPRFDADPMNLFIVVEKGDHHVTILDGDRFEPIHRFQSRFGLHGGPKFSPDGRYVYFASRDGWITKYDIHGLEVVAEIRAGINTRNAAVSADGAVVAVGNYLPHSVVLLDARDLSLISVIDARAADGKSSRVSAVYTAPPRQSFVVALKDATELWEIDYSRLTPGRVAAVEPRRIVLSGFLDDFFFDQQYRYVIGAARPAGSGERDIDGAKVIELDSGKRIADLDLAGMPHLGSGISWAWGDTTVVASQNLKNGEIAIIDLATWKTVKRIQTLGPGFFMRSHKNSRYAWADVFFGPNRDVMHVIDKATLEIVRTLRPAPGKTSAHVEFTRDGAYALVSIWDDDGALVVYDANTLKEVKRLPMRQPSGKYNVYNKINYAEGTSH